MRANTRTQPLDLRDERIAIELFKVLVHSASCDLTAESASLRHVIVWDAAP